MPPCLACLTGDVAPRHGLRDGAFSRELGTTDQQVLLVAVEARREQRRSSLADKVSGDAELARLMGGMGERHERKKKEREMKADM